MSIETTQQLPEQVLGVSTEQVLAIGETAIKMNAVVPEAETALPEALGVLAVIERTRGADSSAETTPALQETPYEKIAKLEKEAKLIAGFDNPREQFLKELETVAQETETAINEHRDYRVQNKIRAETPAGPGFKGFLTKAYRKAKRFVGFLSGRPAVNPNVTAYDAAAGIEKTVKSLLKSTETTTKRLPLLSGLVLSRLSPNSIPSQDKLAFLAPEILTAMFSSLKSNPTREILLKKVKTNPHEFRFVTKIGFLKDLTTYKGVSLEYVQKKSRTFLPAVRDIIPINGPMIGGMYDMASQFLNPNNQAHAAKNSADITKPAPSSAERQEENDKNKPKARKKSKRLWEKLSSKARKIRKSQA